MPVWDEWQVLVSGSLHNHLKNVPVGSGDPTALTAVVDVANISGFCAPIAPGSSGIAALRGCSEASAREGTTDSFLNLIGLFLTQASSSAPPDATEVLSTTSEGKAIGGGSAPTDAPSDTNANNKDAEANAKEPRHLENPAGSIALAVPGGATSLPPVPAPQTVSTNVIDLADEAPAEARLPASAAAFQSLTAGTSVRISAEPDALTGVRAVIPAFVANAVAISRGRKTEASPSPAVPRHSTQPVVAPAPSPSPAGASPLPAIAVSAGGRIEASGTPVVPRESAQPSVAPAPSGQKAAHAENQQRDSAVTPAPDGQPPNVENVQTAAVEQPVANHTKPQGTSDAVSPELSVNAKGVETLPIGIADTPDQAGFAKTEVAFLARLTEANGKLPEPIQVPEPAERSTMVLDASAKPPVATASSTHITTGPVPLVPSGTGQIEEPKPAEHGAEHASASSTPIGKAAPEPVKPKAASTDVPEPGSRVEHAHPLINETVPARGPDNTVQFSGSNRIQKDGAPDMAPPRPAEPPVEIAPTRFGLAREISFRVPGTASGNVDVQLQEKGGNVHIAVRTADRDLASALRQDLGQLVSQLEHRGYRAETWTPLAGAAADGGGAIPKDAAATGNGSDQPSSDSSAGGRGGFRGGEHGRQDQQQQPRPGWTEEFEASFSRDGQRYTEII